MAPGPQNSALFLTASSFVVFGLMSGIFVHASEGDDLDLRAAQPAVIAFNMGPGPHPPRRGLEPKRVLVSANSVPQAIEQCVEDDMALIGAPGAAVTVIHRGEVIFDRGFGYKRQGETDLIDSDTRFRIGSITKMLTTAAVMQQVEEGRVDLDDPVTMWIPEFTLSGQWTAESITVRHLLTHSSAIPDTYEDFPGPVGDQALTEWAADFDEVRLHAPPGTFWNYTSPGFGLAGLIAERASGVFYRELMAGRVFAAAGMGMTTFDPAEIVASDNYSYGHQSQPGGGMAVFAPDDYDSWLAAPTGLAFSTAGDLARWALLLIDGGGSVLSLPSVEAMQSRQVYLDYYPDYYYGLAIYVEKYKGLDLRYHGGSITGWGAWLLWEPETRFVVSILGNADSSLSGAAFCIVDAMLEPESTDPPDLSTDPDTWEKYTGSYPMMEYNGDFLWGEVELRNDELSITFSRPEISPISFRKSLVQLYLDTFIVEGDPPGTHVYELTFIKPGSTPSPQLWLRNRDYVGHRVLPPRRAGARRKPG